MKNVIVCGDCGERELTRAIIRTCTKNGGALVIDGGNIYQTKREPNFCIVTACTLTSISCSGIMVFGKALCQIKPDIALSDMICITDSENTDALHLLQKQRCNHVVTCSMNSRSTVSISGIKSSSKKLISLQRSIRRLDGELTEPYEFYAAVSEEIAIYPLLASCAVMLLSDNQVCDEYDIG